MFNYLYLYHHRNEISFTVVGTVILNFIMVLVALIIFKSGLTSVVPFITKARYEDLVSSFEVDYGWNVVCTTR